MSDISLYIHVPFCTRRCSYCSFYHVQSVAGREEAFMRALEREIDERLGTPGDGVTLKTVFVGGGTPSALSRPSLERLFRVVGRFVEPGVTTEITCELNPEDVDVALLDLLGDAGVNRISLGVQSMNSPAQTVLKRCSPEINLRAIDLVMRRFDNVSFDVLLGVPGSSVSELEDTVRALIALNPSHFSVYCLEPGGDAVDEVAKFFTAVDPERSAEQYLLTCDLMRTAGYGHYEVSSFARPGQESAHNRVYWEGADYIGVGPAAHSFVDGRRFHNVPSLSRYLDAAENGWEGVTVRDDQATRDTELETVMLGLRTCKGIPPSLARCSKETLRSLSTDGLLEVSADRIRLTDRGYLVLNEIIFRILPQRDVA